MNMRIQVYIADAAGDQVVVTTAEASTESGSPCITIDHEGHRIVLDADALISAIRCARIDPRYGDDQPF